MPAIITIYYNHINFILVIYACSPYILIVCLYEDKSFNEVPCKTSLLFYFYTDFFNGKINGYFFLLNEFIFLAFFLISITFFLLSNQFLI